MRAQRDERRGAHRYCALTIAFAHDGQLSDRTRGRAIRRNAPVLAACTGRLFARHEVWVGFPTVKAILANSVATGPVDRYFASAGYKGQLTTEQLARDETRRLTGILGIQACHQFRASIFGPDTAGHPTRRSMPSRIPLIHVLPGRPNKTIDRLLKQADIERFANNLGVVHTITHLIEFMSSDEDYG